MKKRAIINLNLEKGENMKNFQISNEAKNWLKNKKVRLCAGISAVIVLLGSGAVLNSVHTEQENNQIESEMNIGTDAFSDFTPSEPLVFTKGVELLGMNEAKEFEEQEKLYILNPIGEYEGGYSFTNLDGKNCSAIIDGENIHFIYGAGHGYGGYHCANDKNEVKKAFVPLSEYIVLNGYESVITDDMELSEIEAIINSNNLEIDNQYNTHK